MSQNGLNTVNGLNLDCELMLKTVNYDHPGECSPEKDCMFAVTILESLSNDDGNGNENVT